MKFRAKKSTINKELKLLYGVTDKKNTIPVLSYIHIHANQNGLELTATDLDMSMTISLDAEVIRAGDAVISARKVNEIVSVCEDKEIDFDLNDKGTLEIRSGESRWTIPSMALEHYPSVPTPLTGTYSTEARTLQRLINTTLHATTKEEMRWAMQGVLLTGTETEIQVVGTDQHRIAFAKADSRLPFGLKEVLPIRAARELIKILESDGDVWISSDDNHLYFSVGNRNISTRKLATPFPNWESIIQTQDAIKVTVDAAQLAAAFERVVVVTDEKARGVRMDLEQGKLKLSGRGTDIGEATGFVSVKSDAKIALGINASYMLDALRLMDGEISLGITDATTPLSIRQNGHLEVIMPIRLEFV